MQEMNAARVPLDLSDAPAQRWAEEIAATLCNKKGLDIRLYHVEDTTVITEYYVICTGRSSTHVHALSDEANYHMEQCHVPAAHTEGRDGGEWILIDFGPVIVHVFSAGAREYYDLERLLRPEDAMDLKELFAAQDALVQNGEKDI